MLVVSQSRVLEFTGPFVCLCLCVCVRLVAAPCAKPRGPEGQTDLPPRWKKLSLALREFPGQQPENWEIPGV